jgi:hypothetical protein
MWFMQRSLLYMSQKTMTNSFPSSYHLKIKYLLSFAMATFAPHIPVLPLILLILNSGTLQLNFFLILSFFTIFSHFSLFFLSPSSNPPSQWPRLILFLTEGIRCTVSKDLPVWCMVMFNVLVQYKESWCTVDLSSARTVWNHVEQILIPLPHPGQSPSSSLATPDLVY